MPYIFNLIAIIVSLRLWKGSIHNSAEKRNSLINCIFVACGCLCLRCLENYCRCLLETF
jgi:hypothetical protein